jgi:serine/threonine-protein kinase
MADLIQRAVDAIADAGEVDWQALEAAAGDGVTRERLRALAGVAAIARVHSAGAPGSLRPVPFTWGPLEVREWVARGAHGDVFRAWDPRLDRDVALKLVRDRDAAAVDRSASITEGRLLARVHHPNVVTVHGADRIGDEAGIWMEFVHGRTLRHDVESSGPLDVREAVRIGIGVCSGLEAIHRAGLLHRDVKAQNVMRADDGRVLLMDLGASRDAMRPAGGLHGTPLYLAPELLEGREATIATEVYAVGVLLFFLLTRRYPVAADSIEELKSLHEKRAVGRLASVSTVPSAVSAVVDRALSVDPARRFTSIGDMGTALHDALAPSRVRAPVRVLALLLLVMTVAGVFYARANHPGRRRSGADASVQVVRLPAANLGWPSADGRLYPYVDAGNALMLWDVQPGSSRTILRFEGTGESVSAPLLSPAGDRVSYAVTTRAGLHELRISNVDGNWQRAVIAAQRAYDLVPADWSRDGSSILCWLREESGKGDLVTVSTTGGLPRLLYSMAFEWPAHARLSPDGRFVAISAPRPSNPRADELLIVPSDGSGPYPLLDDTANDTVPLWTADGSRLVFLRDSTAVEFSRDAWVVPVRNGRKAGEP